MKQNDGSPLNFPPILQRSLLRNSPLFDYIRFSDFKRLLGNIRATVEKEEARSVAVLSANVREGKTFLVATVALGYAILLQKRVLILNTVLEAHEGSLEIQKIYESDLQFAPAYGGGAPRSRMIDLISPRHEDMKNSQFDTVDFMVGEFLESFKKDYDLILIDTCALTLRRATMMDPIVIAGQADASIIVTSAASMGREAIAAAKTTLDQWKVRVIGVIHNGSPSAARSAKP